MNKQSNAYAIIYIIVLVVVVGSALALTSMSLKSRQTENANVDKMKQILASASIDTKGMAGDQVVSLFNEHIPEMYIVNSKGERMQGDAFTVNVEKQSKIADPAERQLPVYQCQKGDSTLYILPVYGAGLWGPIWGYVSVESNGSTIYGAYFSHASETPGLGAEIEGMKFRHEFEGKQLFKNDKFYPIEVVKYGKGVEKADGPDYVDGVSGGTITSQGVGAMLDNCLAPYESFLSTLKK